MAAPGRQLILDDVETTLAAIATAGGYKTDVATVERVVRGWDEKESWPRPWLGFCPSAETDEVASYDCFGEMQLVLTLDIVGHVSGTTAALRSEALAALLDDLIRAMHLDPSRDGNAVMTTLKAIGTDEGHAEPNSSQGGSGTIRTRWEIVYRRTTGGS